MPVLANLSTDIHSKIINCLGPLNDTLADALGPLKPDLLAYLQESEGRLPVSWVGQGFDVSLEKH